MELRWNLSKQAKDGFTGHNSIKKLSSASAQLPVTILASHRIGQWQCVRYEEHWIVTNCENEGRVRHVDRCARGRKRHSPTESQSEESETTFSWTKVHTLVAKTITLDGEAKSFLVRDITYSDQNPAQEHNWEIAYKGFSCFTTSIVEQHLEMV